MACAAWSGAPAAWRLGPLAMHRLFLMHLAQCRPRLFGKTQCRFVATVAGDPMPQLGLLLVGQGTGVQAHRPLGGRLGNAVLLRTLAIHV